VYVPLAAMGNTLAGTQGDRATVVPGSVNAHVARDFSNSSPVQVHQTTEELLGLGEEASGQQPQHFSDADVRDLMDRFSRNYQNAKMIRDLKKIVKMRYSLIKSDFVSNYARRSRQWTARWSADAFDGFNRYSDAATAGFYRHSVAPVAELGDGSDDEEDLVGDAMPAGRRSAHGRRRRSGDVTAARTSEMATDPIDWDVVDDLDVDFSGGLRD